MGETVFCFVAFLGVAACPGARDADSFTRRAKASSRSGFPNGTAGVGDPV